MQPTVKIAFDLSLAGAGDFFTLGDTTKGVLNNSTFTLAGDVLTDVTDFVRSVTVRRGRPRELANYDAGAAEVTLDNRARLFDPTAGTAISPYASSIEPGKELSIDLAGAPLYRGIIQDWDLSYDLSGDSTTTAKASDAFTILARGEVAAGTAVPEPLSDRLDSVLTAASWPEVKRAIDTDLTNLGANEVRDGQTTLSYLQQVAQSAAGSLFISRDGLVTYRERSALQADTGIVFADDGTGIPFSGIEIEYGSEELYTEVAVVYVGGTAVASNALAQAKYGVIDQTITTFLADGDDAQDYADFYAGRYSTPILRVRSVRLAMDGLSPTQQATVASLELGDLVTVTFTPNGVGDPITRPVSLDGIEHLITPTRHDVTLNFSESLSAFVLGSSVIGGSQPLGW